LTGKLLRSSDLASPLVFVQVLVLGLREQFSCIQG
jgi:hypothetical protein